MRLVNHHYDMNKINIAFMLGGLLLLGTWIWAIYDDYNKPYKDYQRAYFDVYAQQLKLEKKDAWTQDKKDELEDVQQELRQAKQNLEARRGEVDELKKKIEKLQSVDYQQADVRVKSINAKFKPIEYKYQNKLVKAENNPDYEIPESLKRKYKKLKKKYEKAVKRREKLGERIDNLTQELSQKRSRIDELKSKRRSITKEVEILRNNIQRVDDNPLNQFLDAPIVNFIQPRIDIRQYQVSGMYMDYNFDRVPRRDYCKSCHMGIDNPAFKLNDDGKFKNENTRQAFKQVFPDEKERKRYKRIFQAHPRFDLIGPSNSKYPFSEVGCTGCHLGDGRALSFNRAAHTPDNKKEKKRWKKQYHWHMRHYWEEPMLKSQFYEAGFKQFYPYGTKVNIPDASKLNEGRDLFRKYGCNNCHAVEGMNYQRKVGFSLEHIAAKLEKDWVRRWVEKPTDFDPTTRMPQVFHKVNTSSPYHRELSTVVIDSITTFLFERSKPIDLTEPPAAPGDPERGEVLVKETGCMGCHSMEDEGITNSTQAPDLSNVGEKVNRKWLYNWLKNPEAIWPETHMPSMKLTDKEANDITAYLMDQTAEDWEASNFPTELAGDTPLKTVVDNRLEEMAKKFLGQTRGPIATQKKLKEIKQSSSNSKRALKLYVGEQAVTHFGCASCHAIPGYEGKNRIGAELTGWPNKSIHKLAYNYVDIPHTRQDYIMKKLENTGIFDQGLDKSYLAKYRMPKFNLNDKERKKIVTHVMSLKESNRVSPKLQFKQNSSDLIAYEGRKLVQEYNCQGCHVLDGQAPLTDYLRSYYKMKLDSGEEVTLGNSDNPSIRDLTKAHMPPSLTNVGKRLSEDWIFNFLKNPVGPNGRSQIRTYQHVRMPNFQFTDDEASAISQGLAHEGWNNTPPKISKESRQVPPENIKVGRAIFDRVCSNCHIAEGDQAYKPSHMTPNLNYIGQKFHHEGFLSWIEKPTENFAPSDVSIFRHQGMIPYNKVPMSESFLGFTPEGDYSTKKNQMQAVRDYLFYSNK